MRELFERRGFFNSAKMNVNSSYEPSRAQSGKDHRQDEVGGHAAEDEEPQVTQAGNMSIGEIGIVA